MRKPWEEAGSHRDDFGFEDRPRRSDRRFDDRDGFKRRSDRRFDRREDGFGRRDDNFARRDKRRDDRRGGFSSAAMILPITSTESDPVPGLVPPWPGAVRLPVAQAAPSRNALITLDADVARVFATSEAVNAALRHLIALAASWVKMPLSKQPVKLKILRPRGKTVARRTRGCSGSTGAEFQTTDEMKNGLICL